MCACAHLSAYVYPHLTGKNAHDSVCRIIHTDEAVQRQAPWELAFIACVGERSKASAQERKMMDNTSEKGKRKRKRESKKKKTSER